MEDLKLTSLLEIQIKTLSHYNRKTYFHRLIYIIQKTVASKAKISVWKRWLEKGLKKQGGEDRERIEDRLVGIGLIHDRHILNILEGTEDCIDRHVRALMEFQNECKQPNDILFKILIFTPHIVQRNFVDWSSCTVKPPVSLEPISYSENLEEHAKLLIYCLQQLHDLLFHCSQKQQTEATFRKTLATISESCKEFLIPVQILDFLMTSPLLVTGDEFIRTLTSVPNFQSYHETVWPAPKTYLPPNLLE